MKIVFLDIDGVLNNLRHTRMLDEKGLGNGFGDHGALRRGEFTKATVGFDPLSVYAFQRLLEDTDALTVVSSTWRINYSPEQLRSLFKPFNCNPRIFDVTPGGGGFRGKQVEQWLTTHPSVESFVCLDDDTDFHPHQSLVQTDAEVGLTIRGFRTARNILNNNIHGLHVYADGSRQRDLNSIGPHEG